MVKLKFGECLYLILNVLDISNKRLAKYLNVDPSLISKWVHGIRIPAYDSAYIDKITAYVCENIINSFQEDKINELLSESNFNLRNDMTIDEKIKSVLLESQGYSKESSSNEYNNESSITQLNVLRAYKDNTNYSKNVTALSSDDLVLFSYEEIFNHMINMLIKASKINNIPDKPILITFFEGMRYLFLSDEYIIRVKALFNKLIRKGWKIKVLININNDIDSLKVLIKKIRFPFFEENIEIYYLKKYSEIILSKELLVIPDIGAIKCYLIEDNIMDSAFSFRNETAIQVLTKYLNNLIDRYALPLYTSYPIYKKDKYNELFIKTENSEGDQYFIGSNLNLISLSTQQYNKYLLENFSKRVREHKLNKFNQRLAAFETNLKVFKVKEIYIIESILKYIKDQIYIFENEKRNENFSFTIEEVINQIQNVVNRLKSYTNYEVALINKSMINKGNRFSLLIKDKNIVLLESQRNNANSTCLSIKEPTIIDATKLYFLDLWQEIPLVNKDKDNVICWLEDQIDTLKILKT